MRPRLGLNGFPQTTSRTLMAMQAYTRPMFPSGYAEASLAMLLETGPNR